jgi:hypothetical protein
MSSTPESFRLKIKADKSNLQRKHMLHVERLHHNREITTEESVAMLKIINEEWNS